MVKRFALFYLFIVLIFLVLVFTQLNKNKIDYRKLEKKYLTEHRILTQEDVKYISDDNCMDLTKTNKEQIKFYA